MGRPKALVPGRTGVPWVVSGVRRLLAAGCAPVLVVLGAEAERVAAVLAEESVPTVVAADWTEGMGVSLRVGLRELATRAPAATAALVHLVDLPDVGTDVLTRCLSSVAAGSDVLARAGYAGVPGHPVLLGRDHWPALMDSLAGDRGARDYLADRAVELVECGDLASGADVDRPWAPGRSPDRS